MPTQLPRVPSLIPSSFATLAIGRDVSITIFTASSLNSGEKLFFGRGNYFTFPDIHPIGWTVRKPRGTSKVAGLIHHSDYAEVGVKPRNRGLACSGGLADGFFGLTLRWCVVSVRRVLTSVEGDGYGCDGHTDRRGRRRGAARGRLHGVDDRSVCKDDQGAGSVCRGAGRRL